MSYMIIDNVERVWRWQELFGIPDFGKIENDFYGSIVIAQLARRFRNVGLHTRYCYALPSEYTIAALNLDFFITAGLQDIRREQIKY